MHYRHPGAENPTAPHMPPARACATQYLRRQKGSCRRPGLLPRAIRMACQLVGEHLLQGAEQLVTGEAHVERGAAVHRGLKGDRHNNEPSALVTLCLCPCPCPNTGTEHERPSQPSLVGIHSKCESPNTISGTPMTQLL